MIDRLFKGRKESLSPGAGLPVASVERFDGQSFPRTMPKTALLSAGLDDLIHAWVIPTCHIRGDMHRDSRAKVES